ncbi:MAG TPA: GNAT family N-acetyltransferase [Chloroflexia bacterium]|nr:GNAT family N-acetyltransferase [Chloroflexia bacterium]
MSFKLFSPETTAALQEQDSALINLWNTAFDARFPMNIRLWQQNLYGDPSFRPGDILLAEADKGKLAGFALTKRLREKSGQDLEKYAGNGYISALVVHPEFQGQGLGRQLLAAAEAKLWADGATRILPGSSFRHFLPGVPQGNEAALGLLKSAGYQFPERLVNWDLDGKLAPEIYEPALAAVQGASYRQGLPGDEQALLDFLQRIFPGRWHYDMRLYLEQGGPVEDVTLVIDGADRIQGFLMTYNAESKVIGPGIYWLVGNPEWGGIGPLGINSEIRGKGLGLGLVAAGMRYLYNKGARQARIDWTTLTGFYGRLGFQPSITYLLGSKEQKD